MTQSFAVSAFAFTQARQTFEDKLQALIGEDENFDRTGWDEYDFSLELYDCSPGLRLTEAAAQFIWENGFYVCYLNHEDGWQTSYSKQHGTASPFRKQGYHWTETGLDVDPRTLRQFENIASILGEDPSKLSREFLVNRYLGARRIAQRMVNQQID